MQLKEVIRNQILFALISPVLSLIIAFRSASDRFIVLTVTLFFGFAGSVFVYIPGNDGYTHLINIYDNYLRMTLNEFFLKSLDILTFESISGAADLYIHTLSFISGAVLGVPQFLHIFAGLILGYFFSKSFILVLSNKPIGRVSLLVFTFIFFFLIYRSITALNSIRMWTGMWVLFYGSYSWAIFRKKKYLFIIGMSIIFHVSYMIIVIPVFAALFLIKRKILLTVIYILSFSFSLDYFSIEKYIPDLPIIENKTKYNVQTDSDVIEKQNDSNKNFYAKWGEIIYQKYSIVWLSLVLLVFYLRKESDLQFIYLVSIGILLYSFANVIDFSPSLSSRTKTVSSIFFLSSAIYLLFKAYTFNLSRRQISTLNFSFWVFLISCIPVALYHVSYIFNTFSIFIFTFPIISWIIGNDDITIREFLGLLI